MIGDIRKIVVIQSLPKNEKQTGKELYEDVIARNIKYKQPQEIKMTHSYHDVSERNSFIEILKYYIANSEYINGGLLLHFEIHGAENLEGLILGDGSFIKWEEIVDLLREINIKTKNNLYITMATCYGRMMYKGVDLQKKSPYSGYFSASKPVTVGEIMDDFTIIFEALIENGNLMYSHFELEEKGSNKFFYMDSKTTFEKNFESFKNNPEFMKQILESAAKSVNERGAEIDPNNILSKAIYNLALEQAYKEHIKNFEF